MSLMDFYKLSDNQVSINEAAKRITPNRLYYLLSIIVY